MDTFDLDSLPDLHPEIALLVATLLDGRREWKENLGEVTDEAVVWQPYENGPSIGGILLHIAGCETFWFDSFARDLTPDASLPHIAYDNELDQDNHVWPTPPAKPFAWFLEVLDQRWEESLESIRAVNRPDAIYSGRGVQLTFRWFVGHIVEHDSYHGGQMVLLHEMWKRMHR